MGLPMGGLVLITTGNYGSAIFDPMSAKPYLKMSACDECITGAIENGRVVFSDGDLSKTCEISDLDRE